MGEHPYPNPTFRVQTRFRRMILPALFSLAGAGCSWCTHQEPCISFAGILPKEETAVYYICGRHPRTGWVTYMPSVKGFKT